MWVLNTRELAKCSFILAVSVVVSNASSARLFACNSLSFQKGWQWLFIFRKWIIVVRCWFFLVMRNKLLIWPRNNSKAWFHHYMDFIALFCIIARLPVLLNCSWEAKYICDVKQVYPGLTCITGAVENTYVTIPVLCYAKLCWSYLPFFRCRDYEFDWLIPWVLS